MKRLMLVVLVALVVHTPTAQADEGKGSVELLKKGLASFEQDGFSAQFHTRLQMFGGWVDDEALLSNGSTMQESGFRLRRARLQLNGTFLTDWTYELELDVFDHERTGGPLYTAFIDYSPSHWFGMHLGFDRFPVVMSDMHSSARLPHLDRPLGTFLISPANALGLALYSEPWEDHLKLTVGLFNGLRRNSMNLHEGYEETGITTGNRFEELALVARLDLEPLGKVGDSLADLCGCKKLRLAVGAGGFMNNWDFLSLGDGGTFKTTGASAYLHAKVAGFHFFAEYTHEWLEPKLDPDTVTAAGEVDTERFVANASLGYIILPKTLGLAVRGEYIEPQTDVDDEGDEWLVAATVNYYILHEYLKAQLEYVHREEMHGQKISNDMVLAGLQLFF